MCWSEMELISSTVGNNPHSDTLTWGQDVDGGDKVHCSTGKIYQP